MRALAALAVLLLASSCGLFGAPRSTPAPGPGGGSGKATSARAVATELLTGSEPTLPAAFEGLDLFGPSKAAAAVDPRFGPDGSTFEDPRYADVHFSIHHRDGRVRSATVWFGKGVQPGARLEALWGRPNLGTCASCPDDEKLTSVFSAWVNEEVGVRARLKLSSGRYLLEFERIVPVAELLSGETEPLPKPILGKTTAEVQALYPGAVELEDGVLDDLRFPPTKYDVFETHVAVAMRGGKVAGYDVFLDYAELAAVSEPGREHEERDALSAELDAALGRGTRLGNRVRPGPGTRMTERRLVRPSPPVVVEHSAERSYFAILVGNQRP